jgi:uridine kinase
MNSAQVLAFLVDAIAALPVQRPLRVGIDGRSGAGKTTLADALADRLEALGRVCLRASLDDFHPPGHAQRERAGGYTPAQYLQEGYAYAKIRELLLDPFGPQGNRRCRLDFWNSHDDQAFPEDWLEVERDAILLVDGVFLHAPALREQWDFTIWLDIDWQVMLLRGARRDGTWGGPTELLRDAYKTGWIPRHLWYEESVHPHERVDVVIDNSDVEHPYLVRAPRPIRRVP